MSERVSKYMTNSFREELIALGNEEKANQKKRFFKTGEGQYGAGDAFLGLTNGQVKLVCKKYYPTLSLADVACLLSDSWHEVRLGALLVMVMRYQKAKSETEKEEWVKLYLNAVAYINNWDLVDSSCYFILGPHLFAKPDKSVLVQLANSGHLWSQRIAMVSTLHFIRKGLFAPTFEIAKILLKHENDLIHKAIGWMLREAWGKGGSIEVESFLEQNHALLPRTTLRYAIEKMEETKRLQFLNLGK
jgi:3-methyladenine DNA glycosylase AlkD